MTNIAIPVSALQAMQERIALDSSEEVSWPGKAISEFQGRHREIDVTYVARCYQGRLWLDMVVPYIGAPSTALTVRRGKSKKSHEWSEICRGYRRRQKSPMRMSKKWRDLRKAMH